MSWRGGLLVAEVALIDADLIQQRTPFPNLALMKISQYYKRGGHTVVLKTDYERLEGFVRVIISKVFTKSFVPPEILKLPNVKFGGTGFFYDRSPRLPARIEHIKPDYDLYLDYAEERLKSVVDSRRKYFCDYSIGFLTRGCFRRCPFCVNRLSPGVKIHSPLSEFVDDKKSKICLLDDNFFGCPDWRRLLVELQGTKKRFQFRQGLDIRLLTTEKCSLLFSSRYDGDFIFAFDNLGESEQVVKGLRLAREYTGRKLKFYCLCGFDYKGNYDSNFWYDDLLGLFKRFEILHSFACVPYVMRFSGCKSSPFCGIYTAAANWANVPRFFCACSFRDFCKLKPSYWHYMQDFERVYPALSKQIFCLSER